jgi:hypothetical protein
MTGVGLRRAAPNDNSGPAQPVMVAGHGSLWVPCPGVLAARRRSSDLAVSLDYRVTFPQPNR